MMRRFGSALGLVLATVCLVSTSGLSASASSPALSPTTNDSIALYRPAQGRKPARLRTGRLVDGELRAKRTRATTRWSDIAVGRDTMALYDRKTGRLVTGTFKKGVFRPKASQRIGKGFTGVTASCDSVAFYRRSDGTLLTGELTDGRMRDPRRTAVRPEARLVDATCETLVLHDGSSMEVGILRDGHYVPVTMLGTAAGLMAGDRTSLLIRENGGLTTWSSVKEGVFGPASSTMLLDPIDIIAGVGEEVLFYDRSDPGTSRWRLVGGTATDLGPGPSIGRGWTIIAGGR